MSRGWTALAMVLLALCAGACRPASTADAMCLRAARVPLGTGLLELSGRGGIAAGPDGSVYVLDSRAAELISLTPDGEVRWRAGREGEGPGEFVHGTGLQWTGRGLVFRDLENHRLSLWSADGHPRGEVPLQRFRFPGYPGWLGVLDTGAVVAAIPPRSGAAAGGAVGEGVLVLARSGRSAADTLLRFAFPPTLMRRLAGGGAVPSFPPLAAFPNFAVGAEGLFVVPDGSEYRIEVFDRHGRHTATLSGPEGNPPVTAAHRREYLEGRPPSERAADFPVRLPAVAELYTGADGTLLVRTFWRQNGAVRWDRWSAREGRFMHSFTLPESARDVTAARDRLYALELDSLDVPVVRAYRLQGTDRCPGPAVAG